MNHNHDQVVIRNVSPEIDGGRFAIKRTIGEQVAISAEVFADGRDVLSVFLKYRRNEGEWIETPMNESEADCFRGSFTASHLGCYTYTVEAWKNPLRTWWRNIKERTHLETELSQALASGSRQLEEWAVRASVGDAELLRRFSHRMRSTHDVLEMMQDPSLESEFVVLLNRIGPRVGAAQYVPSLRVIVEPVLARFSAWYQLFPRSWAGATGKHGTLKDVVSRLSYIARMGFDVVCLTPIHPIGRTRRKGKNNSLDAQPGDPGSPWAVGSAKGGHKSIHPELGTLRDFQCLLSEARTLGMEVALDIALQSSPDHPYVHEHPNWFRRNTDGSFQSGEDPPNRYEDVYPFDFATEDSQLWNELKSIFVYWIEQGVHVFRIDNPHTKPFASWEWLISDVKSCWPEVIFLAEGLTRPKPMVHLARIGFSASYDYFPWRNSKAQIEEHYTFLYHTGMKEYFRPCLWPNTPQHLPATLQHGGRPAFMIRFLLAATLGANYGIYGPAFELCENRAVHDGSVEYMDSEQYEIKEWYWNWPGNLAEFIAKVNQIRRSSVALQSNDGVCFHVVENEWILAFTKVDAMRTEVILTVVNLDPFNTQSGWLDLDLGVLGIDQSKAFLANDMLTGTRYLWQGIRNYVSLDPSPMPAHILRLEQAH